MMRGEQKPQIQLIISLSLKTECLFTFERLTFIHLTFNTTLLPYCYSCFSSRLSFAVRGEGEVRMSEGRGDPFSISSVAWVRISSGMTHCIEQIDNIFPYVCTVIDHRRRHSLFRTTVTPFSYFFVLYTL